MKRNRGKQQNGKDQRSLQENQNTKGTFHAKMGTIKDRNGMDITEEEDIKKRWQEYTEELYKRAKWLFEQALQMAVKGREGKAKEKMKDMTI